MNYEFDKAVPIPTSVERIGVNIELLRAMAPGESKWWSERRCQEGGTVLPGGEEAGHPDPHPQGERQRPAWCRGADVAGRRRSPRWWLQRDPLAQAADAAARTAKPKRKGGVAKKAAKPAKAPKKAAPKTAPKPKGKRKLVAGVPYTPAALKRAAQ